MVKLRKFSRTVTQRKRMFRNMVTQLIKHERIETTLPKAKSLRHFADKMVTLAKRGTRQSLSKAAGFITERECYYKLLDVLAPRYAARDGGYTRVLRSRIRKGDSAPMAYIEYVDREGELRPTRVPTSVRVAIERLKKKSAKKQESNQKANSNAQTA